MAKLANEVGIGIISKTFDFFSIFGCLFIEADSHDGLFIYAPYFGVSVALYILKMVQETAPSSPIGTEKSINNYMSECNI